MSMARALVSENGDCGGDSSTSLNGDGLLDLVKQFRRRFEAILGAFAKREQFVARILQAQERALHSGLLRSEKHE